MVCHLTTWPVSVCALQRSMVVLGCDHRMTINCSSHGHIQLLLVRAPSTPRDQHSWTLYPLRFVIRQSHWEPLGRCSNRFCSDWQMHIGHGIRVAARTCVAFVKGRLKCLLLLLFFNPRYQGSRGVWKIIIIIIIYPRYLFPREVLKIDENNWKGMMLSPCSQGLAGCRVAEQHWSAAPAPKLADTND